MGSTIAASLDGSGTHSAELCRLAVQCVPEAVEAVSEILRELGAYGVEILGEDSLPPGDDILAEPGFGGPSEAAIWLPAAAAEAEGERLREICRRRIEPFFGPVQVVVSPAPEVDWVQEYRRGVLALRVAPGLWVEPPWDAAKPQPGERVLRIMPGAAFGFGDHATTRTCLRLLVDCVRPGQDVIDMGSGSGILGAAALMLGARRLRAYDLDPLAVAATRDTLRRNGLKAYVRQGTLPQGGRGADIILANISGQGLRPWLPLLRRRLAAGGVLILGGILRQDGLFDAALLAAGLKILDESLEGDWRAVAAALA